MAESSLSASLPDGICSQDARDTQLSTTLLSASAQSGTRNYGTNTNSHINSHLSPEPHTVAQVLPPNTLRNSPSLATMASTSHSTWRQRILRSWLLGKGMVMVMLAQFFGASMNVMTRLLELDGPHGKGMHPFEILFTRMLTTTICSALYMWYRRVPQPFGASSVRGLLILRGTSGFIGVSGLYYSLGYLPLSEATVLTFLAPILSCYICSLVIPNETFTRKQQLAGVISLFGVVLIARPGSLLANPPLDGPFSHQTLTGTSSSIITTLEKGTAEPNPDPKEHLFAIGLALIGVCGATSAYTAIRKIGQRAHPLVSVNYFSSLTTIMSALALLVLPSVSFRFPANLTEIALLGGLGVCGFFLQFLLTAGLSYVPPPCVRAASGDGRGDKDGSHGSRATNMVYTQMLFALFYDLAVFNSTPSAWSWAGSGIILASAIYVAIAKDGAKSRASTKGKEAIENGNSANTPFYDGDLESGRKADFGNNSYQEEERSGLLNGNNA
ncbi:hypothetical protein LOZ61_001436 [Ophidiomyces ophidiicola]|nr:hypothetical protein LOZ61_001436 [Ophidiomyces ophidiicola]KAI1930377.1 hypothetical protein LOZ60_000936 [Ophidiomyces ophidiicola]KAI1967238.1 hypothetical protein LOZ59_000898 [Ophidiomyces ophidiicola]KAI2277016.1 hypothetical protein LOZ05_000845 [Ophidiomyces ophidiicola]KAI2305287.1 hypothetical protein LOZ07_000106 [Ophidiomyces ophidiicola]